MIKSGNPAQWGHFYPDAELIKSDICQNVCRVIYDKDGIHGVFALFKGAEPAYKHIENGNWLNEEPYLTIHRLARSFNGSDTHADNQIMQKLMEKNGFMKCGIIYVKNGTPRIAYHWTAS